MIYTLVSPCLSSAVEEIEMAENIKKTKGFIETPQQIVWIMSQWVSLSKSETLQPVEELFCRRMQKKIAMVLS